ncbi:hypothetical protein B0F90DRAFT_1808856 [Multifurca ochricompacta]|uniref:RING-type E3 ubiquitin transferase n=1 Tax=Multifurca ochricompacta TaxID=376703 RepID=A0AAD4M988_9AGAM|nr:hypothetical protein B0F90DRAFT_1808856 [Multifurca ochricompacta]
MADSLRPRLQSFAGSILSHRIFLYTFASTLAVSTTVINALQNHSNFYSVVVYLSKSGASVLVLANFGLLLALMCGRLFQHIFFGSLRAVEVERLYDRMWFFVTESLLAFTIFRDEFDIPLAVMFGFLLFVKSFHWLLADRIEWMNQMPYPGPPTLFHIRITGLFFLLWITNIVMLAFAAESIFTNGVGVIILFASEYSILMASLVNSKAKYILSAIEFHRAASRGGENAPPWEDKSMWIFYVDLITDFLKLSTYLGFFAVIVTFYGVPLNVVRDVYVTARSFITRLRDLIRYRTATRNMDERYPNATQEEMSAMTDHTCIICREEMMLQDHSTPEAAPPGTTAPMREGPNMTPKKLPCGHIFHFHCLRSWLERQQSCPTCRRPVLDTTPAPTAGRAGQANAPPGVAAAPPGIAAPFEPAADGPQPPVGHLGNFFRNMLRGPPPPAPPPAPYPAVPPQQFAAGGPPPPHYPWGPGFAHPPMGPHYIPPPPQLHPPPVFQGYYGPGGAWQPWGDRRWAGAATQQQQGAYTAHTAAAPAPSTSEEGVQSSRQNIPSENEHPSRQDQGTPSTPRDAAALAALQRLTSGSPHGEVPSTTSQTYQITRTTPRPSVSSTTATRATLNEPPSSVPPHPTSTTPFPAPASTVPNRTVNVPSLIPMFSPVSIPRPGIAPLPSPPIVYRTAPPRQPPPARPLATLPPTLTDAQLAQLDVLTREAIDERLRVLEGVSSVMYRCVEELTRLRSVLPMAAAGPIATATQVQSQPEQGPIARAAAAHESENAPVPELRPLNSDSNSDTQSSDAKPGSDAGGASCIEANGDVAETPTSAN